MPKNEASIPLALADEAIAPNNSWGNLPYLVFMYRLETLVIGISIYLWRTDSELYCHDQFADCIVAQNEKLHSSIQATKSAP